jgi:hypothetical protein
MPHSGARAERAQIIARLTTLDRLRQQAREGNRETMLTLVEQMIDAELRLLARVRGGEVGPSDSPPSEEV